MMTPHMMLPLHRFACFSRDRVAGWAPGVCCGLIFSLLISSGCQTNPGKITPYPGAQVYSQAPSPSSPMPARVRAQRIGYASFYGEELRDRPMANGEPFDPDQLTAASWFYPFDTQIRVKHKNRAVTVRITDRGPAFHLVRQGRIIDLSAAAFRQLADPRLGLIYVRLERLPSNR